MDRPCVDYLHVMFVDVVNDRHMKRMSVDYEFVNLVWDLV